MSPFPSPRAGFTHPTLPAFRPLAAVRPIWVESPVREHLPRSRSRKRNRLEPIEPKPRILSEMRGILINRTHWPYLLGFQRGAAKNDTIFANSVRSRTRIHGKDTSGRPCLRTNLECRFASETYGARDLSRRNWRARERPGTASGRRPDANGRRFGAGMRGKIKIMRRACGESLRRSRRGRASVRPSGKGGPAGLKGQSRNVPCHQCNGNRGCVMHPNCLQGPSGGVAHSGNGSKWKVGRS